MALSSIAQASVSLAAYAECTNLSWPPSVRFVDPNALSHIGIPLHFLTFHFMFVVVKICPASPGDLFEGLRPCPDLEWLGKFS